MYVVYIGCIRNLWIITSIKFPVYALIKLNYINLVSTIKVQGHFKSFSTLPPASL